MITETTIRAAIVRLCIIKTVDLSEAAELDMKTQREIITFRKFYKQN